MSIFQIAFLAIIQGFAELLPVSSSAHVILAEKWMGLDPSSPELTFLLVMLHTGTMVAVLFYFWPRWVKLDFKFFKLAVVATGITGCLGLILKKVIEKLILAPLLGDSHAEIEHMFKSLPLIAAALFFVGILIIFSGRSSELGRNKKKIQLSIRHSVVIGVVQGLCLPFRGFSRSGATISTGMLLGISRSLSESFSFALAVLITPPVIMLELHRLYKAAKISSFGEQSFFTLIQPGVLGMGFSFAAGMLALRWLSSWLEKGRWKYFGYYCLFASCFVLWTHFYLSN